MAEALLSSKSRDFWCEVQRVNKKGKPRVSVPSVDGISDDPDISNHFASKLHSLLNSHDSCSVDNILNSISSSLSPMILRLFRFRRIVFLLHSSGPWLAPEAAVHPCVLTARHIGGSGL